MSAPGETPARPRRRVLRRGWLPLPVHGLIEYGLGALAIAAPFLLNFDSGAASAFGILLGAAIVALGALTKAPTGVVRRLPIDSHIVLDYVAAALAVAGPFAFGFADDAGETAFFIAFGVVFGALALATRYRRPADES